MIGVYLHNPYVVLISVYYNPLLYRYLNFIPRILSLNFLHQSGRSQRWLISRIGSLVLCHPVDMWEEMTPNMDTRQPSLSEK